MITLNTKLDISSLKKAVASLDSAIRIFHTFSTASDDEKRLVGAGVIQNFEFTYELCWKMMKRWIEMNIGHDVVDGVTRRELFRLGTENKLIDDVAKWMEFHSARNISSHTYDEDTAEEVIVVSFDFLSFAKNFLEKLEDRL